MKEVTNTNNKQSRGFIIKNQDGVQLGYFSLNNNIPAEIASSITVQQVIDNLKDCQVEEYIKAPAVNPFAKK